MTGEFLLRGNAVLRDSRSLLTISLLSGERILCEVHHGSDTKSVTYIRALLAVELVFLESRAVVPTFVSSVIARSRYESSRAQGV